MNRALRITLILVVTIATAVAAAITIRDRDEKTKTWASFCNEAYLIAQENRTRLPDGTAAARDLSLAQVERLAERSPSDAVAADLRTAAPVLARPYTVGPLAALTSPVLAATTRADSALVERCEVGRSVFDPGNLQNRPAAN
ncbi:MAG: hypothetical protein U0W40_01160 [Acidimicrobiia bacterium]